MIDQILKITWLNKFLHGIRAMDKEIVIDPHSPYCLHPSERLGVAITPVMFNRKNYDLWQQAVRTALKSKYKLGFIVGTITRPRLKEWDNATEYNASKMANSMICSWIINVIDPKLHTSIVYVETMAIMWENLRKRYVVTNTPKIHQLKTDIAAWE